MKIFRIEAKENWHIASLDYDGGISMILKIRPVKELEKGVVTHYMVRPESDQWSNR